MDGGELMGLLHCLLGTVLLQGSGRSLPVGLQIIGREYNEAGILQLGHMLEQTLQLSRPALAV
jgi:Asp-tRNA(Asn)/Glu-tRNA(Gln) amidotransferase A subunit family amidase